MFFYRFHNPLNKTFQQFKLNKRKHQKFHSKTTNPHRKKNLHCRPCDAF
jgi:hypothetical protein